MSTKIDGKQIAAEIKTNLAERVNKLKAQGIQPGLGTLLVGEDPGSMKYVAGKHADCQEVGITSVKKELPADASFDDIAAAVRELNEDPACTGFIVQLPLPKGINENAIIDMIDPAKDADGMHPYNLGELVLHVRGDISTPLPCTPRGVLELLDAYDIDLNGKEVCVLGRGITIGRTIGLMLTRNAVNATVTLCNSRTRNLPEVCRQADIVVVAIGQGIETRAFEHAGIPIHRGTIEALSDSKLNKADMAGIFAGGDCVTGPASAIKAIAAGKVAAANIDEYLGFRHEITVDVSIPDPDLSNKLPHGRVNTTEREAGERKHDFICIECGLSRQGAMEESARCLRCDHFGYGIFKGGRKEKW